MEWSRKEGRNGMNWQGLKWSVGSSEMEWNRMEESGKKWVGIGRSKNEWYLF